MRGAVLAVILGASALYGGLGEPPKIQNAKIKQLALPAATLQGDTRRAPPPKAAPLKSPPPKSPLTDLNFDNLPAEKQSEIAKVLLVGLLYHH